MTATRPQARFFDAGFFTFLTQLARHNDREWFQAHKDQYESEVRDPMLRFIAALDAPLRKLAPRFVADPSPVGGSMMRIYRDIRFARDKSPYKKAVAAHFWSAAGKGEGFPAFFIHLEPGKSLFGGGLWRPAPDLAKKVRDVIAGDVAGWRRIVQAPKFRSTFRLMGDSLKRVPAGYDPDNPVAEDLKRKDFIFGSDLTDRQVTSKELLALVVERCKTAMPFMRLLLGVSGGNKRARA